MRFRLDCAIESPEQGSEIILDHLALPSVVPEELANTRFKPAQDTLPQFRYEGSWYFRGAHNWVDLNEIRFLEATGDNTIVAEYDLVVAPPALRSKSESLVLIVPTQVEPYEGEFDPGSARYVPSLGTLTESSQDFWECDSFFDEFPIRIQLRAEPDYFDNVAAFATAVIAENAITPTDIWEQIAQHMGGLQWKFDHFKVRVQFRPKELVPRWFSFYRDSDSGQTMLGIRLSDPQDTGNWYLRYRGTSAYDLEWIPHL